MFLELSVKTERGFGINLTHIETKLKLLIQNIFCFMAFLE